jgi:hypothetical protein
MWTLPLFFLSGQAPSLLETFFCIIIGLPAVTFAVTAVTAVNEKFFILIIIIIKYALFKNKKDTIPYLYTLN